MFQICYLFFNNNNITLKSVFISSEYDNMSFTENWQHFLFHMFLQYYNSNVMFLLTIYKYEKLKRLKNKNV